jgi:hypothetical protein
MRKIYSVFVAVLLLLTPYAQAKTCAGNSCNYIDNSTNSDFSSGLTGWTTGGASIATEACYSSNAAELQNTEYLSQSLYVDGTYSSFKLTFRAFLPGDTDNFYDELKVRVTNTDTGVYEEQVLHGSSYTSHCGSNSFYLANNYSNAHVTVKFSSGSLSSHVWQIDDVGFWAYY